MKVWERIKSFDFKQLLQLGRLFIFHPNYIRLTLNASAKAMQVASKEYGNKHSKSNKANAFRHALWSILLGQAVFKKSQDLKKAKAWSEKVTTLHEKLAPNSTLDRCMDLHNNEIGRNFLDNLITSSEEETITFLKQKAAQAKQINNPEDVDMENLVYISE